MASASMDAVIRAEHRSPTDPRSPGPKPSHPGRVLLRFEESPVFDAGESRFRCRSTASVRKGAEPEHLRTRGGCSYRSRRTPFLMQENPGLGVGAPPSVRTRFGCRSTALGAKGSRARAPSHPGRVLLRFEKNPGLDVGESRFGCGSTALGAKGSQARAPSHPGRVLLRFGESSGFDVGESRFGCRSTAPGANPVWV